MSKPLAFPLAVLLALAAGAAGATMTSSAASDSLGASSVGSSTSITNSSNASSGNNRTASGDYRITDVALDENGRVRYTLAATRAEQGAAPLHLHVPRAVADKTGLAAGHVVHARPRPYGVEFADARDGRAFFLVLDDPWYRELRIRPVAL